MHRGGRFTVLFGAWLAIAAWTVPWAVFRGEHAHGGYIWWQQVHHGGLALLMTAALALLLRMTRREALLVRGSGATGFAGSLLLVTWLSFQVGLARHEPVGSVSEFLLNEP